MTASQIPEVEMEARHTLADRYHDQQKKNIIDEKARGIRTAINILILEERKLIAESEKLKTARPTAGRGGA